MFDNTCRDVFVGKAPDPKSQEAPLQARHSRTNVRDFPAPPAPRRL